MKNFALVRDGLPILTATPANDADYKNGQAIDGGVWREFSLSIGHEELLNEWYFYYSWKKRPVKPGQFYTWDKSIQDWQFDIVAARLSKAKEIEAACETAILAGFESSALGQLHHYPADLTDQANLTASVMRSMLPETPPGEVFPFKCADGGGVWLFREHSIGQIQQAGRDGYQSILSSRQRNAQLQSQVEAATSQAEIEAITW